MFGWLKSPYKAEAIKGGITVTCRDQDVAGLIRASQMLSGKTYVELGLDAHNCNDVKNLRVTVPTVGEHAFAHFYRETEELPKLLKVVGKSMHVEVKHVGVRYSSTQRQCFPYIEIAVTTDRDKLKAFRAFLATATGAEIHTRDKGYSQTVMDIYSKQGVDMLTPLMKALEHKLGREKA